MLKLIVADDEKWVRAAITSIIPFEGLGLTLAGEASNGLEALELCGSYSPDILITDIMMPGLTGLELIQQLKNAHPDMKIIIISGYSEFEYSKAAMKLGVSDYILKPVDEAELEQALVKARDAILEQRRSREEMAVFRTRYDQASSIVCEKFLNKLIVPNSITLSYIKSCLADYGINFGRPFFTLAVFQPVSAKPFDRDDGFDRFKQLVEKVMQRYHCSVTFPLYAEEPAVVCIINHAAENAQASLDKPIHISQGLFRKKFGGEVAVGLSLQSPQLKSLPELYLQARNALDASFWEDSQGIYCYSQGLFADTVSFKVSEHWIDKIACGIQLSDCQPFFSCIEWAAKRLDINPRIKPSAAADMLWSLIQGITGRLGISMSFIEYEQVLMNQHPYQLIRNTRNFKLLCNHVREMAVHICDHYTALNSSTTLSVIENVKRIMEQNYHNDISLESIAKFVHLNSTYLSELFKKDTGMSFVEYKTMLRMEQAKKLLLTTSLSASEVSSRIGYTDPKYFSKLFKKCTGVTVHKFKTAAK